MTDKEKINQLKIQKDHIMENNKNDENYEDQLKDIEEKIKNIEYSMNYKNLKTNCDKINRKLYIYEGPVYEFDKYIENTSQRTYAKSEKQAINNITFKIKIKLKRSPNTCIKIDKSKLKVIE